MLEDPRSLIDFALKQFPWLGCPKTEGERRRVYRVQFIIKAGTVNDIASIKTDPLHVGLAIFIYEDTVIYAF